MQEKKPETFGLNLLLSGVFAQSDATISTATY